jgi:hypothetical protein
VHTFKRPVLLEPLRLVVQELEAIANSAPSGGGKGHSRYASSGGGYGGGGYGGAMGMGGGFGMGGFGGGMKRGLSPQPYGDDRSTRPRF